MSAIAGWLYGSTQYKELAIIQDDMPDYYYRCIIVGIEQSIVAGRTVGIVLSVRCDAPYAYMSTADTIITSNNYTESLYHNRSNVNKYYRPMITVEASGGTSVISINNTGDIIGEFEISGIPSSGAIIVVDCTRCILTSEEMPDVYSSCNLNFPRFLRGANMIEVSGECVITIQNRFPMIIGT
ncbi:hypothetical protein SDC9_56163 [bioreactor metagenome]|uniref:Phage tail protein n=1 Tax=bioreactor metagenome TaxID=1076179 RepID=A0A644X137_9ZZZZ